jgi:hypothetical protein
MSQKGYTIVYFNTQLWLTGYICIFSLDCNVFYLMILAAILARLLHAILTNMAQSPPFLVQKVVRNYVS